MRKIFTCVSLVISSLLATAPAMAQQTQITDQEKVEFVKAVVPAMLEQVKQISGIDIVSLADPTIKDVLSSPLFGTTSVLRSDTPVDLSLCPDSMVLNLSEVIDLSSSDMSAYIAAFLDNIQVTFDNYYDFEMTATDGRLIAISVPGKMTATLASAFSIDLNLTFGEQTGLLPFSTFEATLDLGSLASVMTVMGYDYDFSDPLLSMSESSSNGVYTYDVTVSSTLLGLIDEDAASVTDYEITVDMSSIQSATITASLYANLSNATLPLGDAEVYLNLQSLASGSYQADSLIITSYMTGTATVEDYEKIVRYSEGSGTKLERHTVTYEKGTGDTEEWEWESHIMNTFTGNSDLDDTDLTYSIIQGIINDLTAGNSSSFTLTTTEYDSVDDTTGTVTDQLIVTPSMIGTQAGQIEISILESDDINDDNTEEGDDDTNGLTESMLITLNIPTTSSTITIDFDPAQYDEIVATIYVTSNAMTIITDNEEIEDEVEDVIVSTNDNGLYVRNGEGSYIIVNMVGKILATGLITSNEQQISVNMPKGIYMISINQTNNSTPKRTTVKFVK